MGLFFRNTILAIASLSVATSEIKEAPRKKPRDPPASPKKLLKSYRYSWCTYLVRDDLSLHRSLVKTKNVPKNEMRTR